MLLRTLSRRPAGARGVKPAGPGRIARRILMVSVLVVLALGAERGAFQRGSDALFGPRIDWHNDYAMSEHLYNLVVRRRLTDVPRACLLLNIHGEDPAASTGIDVFERPTPACMGPQARTLHLLPRLFGLRVDRDAGVVATDAGTPDRYHPLR